MDGKNSHEQPEAVAFDELNFSQSPHIEPFLRHLRAGEIEDCLQLIANNRIRILETDQVDDYHHQLLLRAENARKYERALEQVKGERDTLLSGVYHIYKTFSFVFNSIEQTKEGEEPNKQAAFLAKVLRTLGLKNVSPAAVSVIQAIVSHLRRNMESVTQNVEQLAERLRPSLDILIRHKVVEGPITAPKETN